MAGRVLAFSDGRARGGLLRTGGTLLPLVGGVDMNIMVVPKALRQELGCIQAEGKCLGLRRNL